MKIPPRLLALLFPFFAAIPALYAETPVAATAEQAVPLAIGERAPAALVKTATGTEIDLAQAMGGKPTLLIFYRGGWCPFCNTQLVELQAYQERFVALGYQILAVSADASEALPATAEKTRAAYTLLSDREMKAASAYKIAWRVPAEMAARYASRGIALAPIPGSKGEHWLPVPSVFIIGRDGLVKYVFSDPNFKLRPPAAKVYAAAEDALK